jgi:hypothetical protein
MSDLREILERKPTGLIKQLKYFEFISGDIPEHDKKTISRIRSEINNIRGDIELYEEPLKQTETDISELIKSTETDFIKTLEIYKNIQMPWVKFIALMLCYMIPIGYFMLKLFEYFTIEAFFLYSIVVGLSTYIAEKVFDRFEIVKIGAMIAQIKKLLMKLYQLEDVVKELLIELSFIKEKEFEPTGFYNNQDWIKERFFKYVDEGESKRQSAFKTKEDFQLEFGRKPPSESQIYRYAGIYP